MGQGEGLRTALFFTVLCSELRAGSGTSFSLLSLFTNSHKKSDEFNACMPHFMK